MLSIEIKVIDSETGTNLDHHILTEVTSDELGKLHQYLYEIGVIEID